jgi:hypothetical protein
MSNETFNFNEFIRDSKECLVNTKNYFSSVKTSGGMTGPILKAVLYGAIAGILSFIWNILGLSGSGVGMFGTAAGPMIIISYTLGAIIGLFIGSIVLLLISSICNGNTDFEANVRVSAVIMVVMPISAFFSFLGHFSIYLDVIISLAVSGLSLWLLFNGLILALKSKPDTTKIVIYVLAALIVIFTLIGLGAKRKANRFMNEFNNSDMKELMKDINKN